MPENASLLSDTESEVTVVPEYVLPIQDGHWHKRARWQRIPVPTTAPPPKASIQEADLLPEMKSNWFKILTFE
ncbi:hypothetical protein DFS33DRAFT_1382575 [Desarmillaria ectypa]|nr:hypothetical protein DFS33DRAFT_1382575 [Desarmillaria ectypa]